MRLMLIFAILFNSFNFAQAEDLSGHVSVGMGKSVLDARTFERLGAIGVSYGNTWRVQANGGYWFAPAAGERSSLYGSLQGGLEVVGDGGTFAGIMFGPAVIQADDSKLSGNFQFHLTPIDCAKQASIDYSAPCLQLGPLFWTPPPSLLREQ